MRRFLGRAKLTNFLYFPFSCTGKKKGKLYLERGRFNGNWMMIRKINKVVMVITGKRYCWEK
jgi:hypothetical protein